MECHPAHDRGEVSSVERGAIFQDGRNRGLLLYDGGKGRRHVQHHGILAEEDPDEEHTAQKATSEH